MHLQATASRAATIMARNPALFGRLLLAKLNTVRRMPVMPVRKRIGDVIFEFDLEHYRGTAPMYFGSYALVLVQAMKRFLKPGDTFIDVGANIGYLSAIGAEMVGPRGEVHCFEPVSDYFARLRRLAQLNPAYSIIPSPCGLGEIAGQQTIYVTRGAGQSTFVPSYKMEPDIVATLDVPVARLDSYLETHQIGKSVLIKIDAEGFELPILKGLQGYFERTSRRPPIICEIAPRAYSLLGRSIQELETFMHDYGYVVRDPVDGVTPVDLKAIVRVEDVLFVQEPHRVIDGPNH
jgi:FkbM family methyltransferase